MASSHAGQGAARAGGGAPRALDASDQPIPVCSHHLPRRIERCVSVMSAGVWGSAYYASVHLAGATSHYLAIQPSPLGNAQLERAATREPDDDRERATARPEAPCDVDDSSSG